MAHSPVQLKLIALLLHCFCCLCCLGWEIFFPTDLQLRNDSSILALTLTSAVTPFLSESK